MTLQTTDHARAQSARGLARGLAQSKTLAGLSTVLARAKGSWLRFVPMELHPEWLQFSLGRNLSRGLNGAIPIPMPPCRSERLAKEWRQGNRLRKCQGSDFGFGPRIYFGFRPSGFRVLSWLPAFGHSQTHQRSRKPSATRRSNLAFDPDALAGHSLMFRVLIIWSSR